MAQKLEQYKKELLDMAAYTKKHIGLRIVFAGNISASKSTSNFSTCELLRLEPTSEPYQENPHLYGEKSSHYKDIISGDRHGGEEGNKVYKTQLWFIWERKKRLLDLAQKWEETYGEDSPLSYGSDRTRFEEIVFSASEYINRGLDRREFSRVMARLWAADSRIEEAGAEPNLIVWLKNSHETLMSRIPERARTEPGREQEAGIPDSYITGLENGYNGPLAAHWDMLLENVVEVNMDKPRVRLGKPGEQTFRTFPAPLVYVLHDGIENIILTEEQKAMSYVEHKAQYGMN
jgi:deoxyadenosine/deoxycytidine kinase